MKYFELFPKVITNDVNGTSLIATNLMARVNILPELQNNPLLFYAYDMQDGDKPDTIAAKYYNNPYRYWIFLYGNNIMDPAAELPLSVHNFEAYLNDKYEDAAILADMETIPYTQFTPYQYQKIVTTLDSVTDIETIRYFNVDIDTYISISELAVNLNFFDDGSLVTITTTKRILSIFDYENDLNESKRQVKLINTTYAADMEKKFKSLMNP